MVILDIESIKNKRSLSIPC